MPEISLRNQWQINRKMLVHALGTNDRASTLASNLLLVFNLIDISDTGEVESSIFVYWHVWFVHWRGLLMYKGADPSRCKKEHWTSLIALFNVYQHTFKDTHMLINGICRYLLGLDCGVCCFLSDCGCTRLKAAYQCETDGTISKGEESKSSCLHHSCYWVMSEPSERVMQTWSWGNMRRSSNGGAHVWPVHTCRQNTNMFKTSHI